MVGQFLQVDHKVIRHKHLLTSAVRMMIRSVDLHLVEVDVGRKSRWWRIHVVTWCGILDWRHIGIYTKRTFR
jgi:hypothetical protein